MSDVETNEESVEEKMEAVYSRILVTMIFACVGWTMFSVVLNFGGHGMGEVVGILIASLIATGPMLVRMYSGGFKAMFQLPEYEVITTYGDGRKVSDHGFESTSVNTFIKIFLLLFFIFIGSIATMIYLVILAIRYFYYYAKAHPKPSFARSAILLYIIGAVVFIGSPAITWRISKIYYAVRSSSIEAPAVPETQGQP